MKPITKKYHSKNVQQVIDNALIEGYDKGLEEGRQKALQEELEFLLKLKEKFEEIENDITEGFGFDDLDKEINLYKDIEKRISKIKKELKGE